MKRRGILLAIGVLALATVSVAATVQLLYFQLPEPEQADGEGLIRWMVTRDLNHESTQLRRRLLTRVQETLSEVLATSDKPIDEQFDPKYRPQFWSNVDVLMKEWYYQQSEVYAATPPAEREEMLDNCLKDAHWLSDFKPSAPKSSNDQPAPNSSASDPINSAVELMRKMNLWIEQAPKGQQKQLREFTAALEARVVARTFQGLINSLKGS